MSRAGVFGKSILGNFEGTSVAEVDKGLTQTFVKARRHDNGAKIESGDW